MVQKDLGKTTDGKEAAPGKGRAIPQWCYVLGYMSVIVSIALYGASLRTTAIFINDEPFTGARVLGWSFLTLFMDPLTGLGLIANLLLIPAWGFALLTFGDMAAAMSVVAVPLAVSTTLIRNLHPDYLTGQAQVVHLKAGFYRKRRRSPTFRRVG